MEELNPKEIYEKLIVSRKAYEDRAEQLAKVTIPYLFTGTGSTETTKMNDTYASRYSAIAINSLASNMSLTLLPPSGSSFRFDPDSKSMEDFTQGDADMRAEIMALLGTNMSRVNKEIENQQIRPQFHELLLNMIAVAPVVVEKVEKEGIKWHSIRNFAVKLGVTGEPLQIVVRETMDRQEVPEDIDIDEGVDTVDLYTLCNYSNKEWIVTQSIEGDIVGKETKYKKDKLPYVYLGWTRQKGDTYHRPYAEQYYGILEDYANMNKILVQGSLIASKSLIMVNPLGVTRKSDVADSSNGDVIDGKADEVTAFQLGKNYDFQVPMQHKNELIQQIDRAFLSRQGTQRQAERVTAEEIRQDAQELEKSLAGIYSVMAKKFNKWLILQIMEELNIKFDSIDVAVVTGLDALGRNIESQKMDNFMTRIANLGLQAWLKEDEIISRYASYDGIDTVNLVKSPNEVATERQQANEQALQQQLLTSGADSLGKSAGQAAVQPQQ